MLEQDYVSIEGWKPIYDCAVCGKPAYGLCPQVNEPLCPKCHTENCDYALMEIAYKFVKADYLGVMICGWQDCIDKSFIRVMSLDETYLCMYHAKQWYKALDNE